MSYPGKIDLHMHTSVSDGTDTPQEIIRRVKEVGIELFSVTDHDAIKGCKAILKLLKNDDPAFISGVEFSCKDEEGRYHILGYGYDVNAPVIAAIVKKGHSLRMSKLTERLAYLNDEFGFTFSPDDVEALRALDNPGKPHIGNLMVKYGYAPTKEYAITNINGMTGKTTLINAVACFTSINLDINLRKSSLEHKLYLTASPLFRQAKLRLILALLVSNALWCALAIKAHTILISAKAL